MKPHEPPSDAEVLAIMKRAGVPHGLGVTAQWRPDNTRAPVPHYWMTRLVMEARSSLSSSAQEKNL